jgi:flagellar hook-basal body complex protein FliE
MVLGKTDIHQAMMTMEEAHISLRMLIQVRNKIIAAYEEMMRMQV